MDALRSSDHAAPDHGNPDPCSPDQGAPEPGSAKLRPSDLQLEARIGDGRFASVSGLEIEARIGDGRFASVSDLQPEARIGGVSFTSVSDLQLEARIGGGSFASVYRALERLPDGSIRRIALKCLSQSHLDQPEVVQAFQDEAVIGLHLEHPHIVQTYGLTCWQESPAIRMALIDGIPVHHLIHHLKHTGQRLSPAAAARLIVWLADALDHAWNAPGPTGAPLHVIHRDLKPPNLLLDRDGRLKLADFGVAKTTFRQVSTATGLVKGTLRYLSPEQASGRKSLTAASDQFTVGSILYELLELRYLFDNPEALGCLIEIPRAAVEPDLQALHEDARPLTPVLRRMLARRPEDRFPSAAALRDVLLELLPRLEGAGTEQEELQRWVGETVAARTQAPRPRGNGPSGGERPAARPERNLAQTPAEETALTELEAGIAPGPRPVAQEDDPIAPTTPVVRSRLSRSGWATPEPVLLEDSDGEAVSPEDLEALSRLLRQEEGLEPIEPTADARSGEGSWLDWGTPQGAREGDTPAVEGSTDRKAREGGEGEGEEGGGGEGERGERERGEGERGEGEGGEGEGREGEGGEGERGEGEGGEGERGEGERGEGERGERERGEGEGREEEGREGEGREAAVREGGEGREAAAREGCPLPPAGEKGQFHTAPDEPSSRGRLAFHRRRNLASVLSSGMALLVALTAVHSPEAALLSPSADSAGWLSRPGVSETASWSGTTARERENTSPWPTPASMTPAQGAVGQMAQVTGISEQTAPATGTSGQPAPVAGTSEQSAPALGPVFPEPASGVSARLEPETTPPRRPAQRLLASSPRPVSSESARPATDSLAGSTSGARSDWAEGPTGGDLEARQARAGAPEAAGQARGSNPEPPTAQTQTLEPPSAQASPESGSSSGGPGSSQEASLDQPSRSSSGSVCFSSWPFFEELWIDDRWIADGPGEPIELSKGRYRVRLRSAQYPEATVTVEPGKSQTIIWDFTRRRLRAAEDGCR